MNIIMLLLSFLISGVPVDEQKQERPAQCIEAPRIVKPATYWKMVSKDEKTLNGDQYIIVGLHNPLNKEETIDAKFILAVDSSKPDSYMLMLAAYYNKDTTVIFRRIYTVQPPKDKKDKEISTPTQCFSREVRKVIKMEPEVITAP